MVTSRGQVMGWRPRTRPGAPGSVDAPPVADWSATGPTTSRCPAPLTPAPAAARARDQGTSNRLETATRTAAAPPAQDPATWNQLLTVLTNVGARAAHPGPRTSNRSTCSAAEASTAQVRTDPATCWQRPAPTLHRQRAARTAELAGEQPAQVRTDPTRYCCRGTSTARKSMAADGRWTPGRTGPVTWSPNRSFRSLPEPAPVPTGPTMMIPRPRR